MQVDLFKVGRVGVECRAQRGEVLLHLGDRVDAVWRVESGASWDQDQPQLDRITLPRSPSAVRPPPLDPGVLCPLADRL